MATFSNIPVQSVASGQNVAFGTANNYPCNCQNSIIYTGGSGQVGLRGGCSSCRPAKYRVSFGANIAVPTGGTLGPIALALSQNGEAIQSTQATVTPTAENAFFNVSRETEITVPCGAVFQIGVRNVVPSGGTAQAVSVSNASLSITRVA